MEYLFIPCFFCTFARETFNHNIYNMKKITLMYAMLLSLTACAQREYFIDDNVYYRGVNNPQVVNGYDEVIQEEQTVKNVLVRHQQVTNVYHVNEARENHYIINNVPYYRAYVRGHYIPSRTRVNINRRSYYCPYTVERGYYRVEVPEYNDYSYKMVENNSNKWFFYFQLNSDYLTNREELGHLIDYAKTNQNVVFYIDSYADAETGTQEYNMDISTRRANAIISVLLREGINRNRLFVKNHGCYIQEYNTNSLNRCVTVKASFR